MMMINTYGRPWWQLQVVEDEVFDLLKDSAGERTHVGVDEEMEAFKRDRRPRLGAAYGQGNGSLGQVS